MKNTLENKSTIWVQKSKFFLSRSLTYFGFLLIPIYIPKTLHLNTPALTGILTLYIAFMMGQWFLLGKEIDHRFKIYFRVNSSFDRILYRVLLGFGFISIYFNVLSFLPSKWIYNFFWVTFIFLGLFYSWPTRGKIIHESVSSSLGEFKFLDSFEKTLVFLLIVMLIASMPELPNLSSVTGLKLYFDPTNKISDFYWNFLTVNYYPFYKYEQFNKVAWSMHFYLVNISIYLIAAYALFRYFISRRLALLGVFALISTWSFSKIISFDYGSTLLTTYSLIWAWSVLWVTKSSTYRTGLFLGLMLFMGCCLSGNFIILLPVTFLLMYLYFLQDRTDWYKRQMLRYSSLGVALILISIIFTGFNYTNIHIDTGLIGHFKNLIERKAFFILSFFGLGLLILKLIKPHINIFQAITLENKRIRELFVLITTCLLVGTFFDKSFISDFSFLWILTILSLFPLEIVFQNMSRLRSNRNMIYLIYILICLLDSHFEGRVKIFLRLFDS